MFCSCLLATFCSCSCYRFGKNMWKANLGSCFLQVQTTLVFIGVVRELFS
ncbi:Prolyl oligopeptidase family protein [Zea mays]|uniref:Prolyl oligopeptidase family protein n=1 Tax=Zea mays TaxID=4577 RepID=A0A1D6E3C2_MAIZE|nr:Prolyl oligopeptidase family protein [Zea mays]ONM15042.1 Prolyl oligopeptidase family protein [Zea mays]ONM15051.1 Prolyl oligopeptidase family protein [Zea mays]ONM15052.1 Prolyl oligopeptidase family protein [Zea mays]ONM15056.1 Prolyl oligopeptidase family protein [Zea mays]